MTDDTRIDLGIDGLGPAEHVGSGAFADVYRAEQLRFRRIVAVKVLRAQVSNEDAEARFERECYALGAVSDHPHIVGVHEGGFTRNGRAYLVMDYLPGGSMLDRLKRFGVMSPPDVLQIGVKIGYALEVAHRAGVLHRDIKPSNIMISKNGEPALGDFGIARIHGGHQTATGLVTASFLHTPPEVLEGQPPTEAADIYSLASTMYELLSGAAPYYRDHDESVWPVLTRILSEPIASPAPFGLSAQFCQLFDRATARNPNLRYRDARELAEDLRRINPGSIRDRHDASRRAEERGVAAEEAPESGHPIDLASEAAFLDHTLGIEPAPTATFSGPSPVEFKARQKAVKPVAAQEATPIGMPDVTTVSQTGNLSPQDLRDPNRSLARIDLTEPTVTQTYFDPEWELYDRRHSSNMVGLKAFAVVALSILLVVLVAVGTFRIVFWGASELRASQAGSDASVLADSPASDTIRQRLGVPATSSVELQLADAKVGPLIAGRSYTPKLGVASTPTSVRYLIDGQPADSAEASFVVPAGRHVLQAEIQLGEEQEITQAIDLFGIDGHDGEGIQVNLGSAPTNPDEWPGLLAAYDQLVVDGHSEATIGRDDQPTGSTWRIFVPNSALDPTVAEGYCQKFQLSVPSQCFVGPAILSDLTGG